jgi:CelD/BcsL family acetyltransferase involved in cellulose biosynthesis
VNTPVEHIQLGDGWMGTIYRQWNFPTDIVEAWEKLAHDYGDAGIFLSYGWFENWWKIFGNDKELYVIVLTTDDMINGIFPCEIGSTNGSQEIAFLTNDHTFHNDLIINPQLGSAAVRKLLVLLSKTYPHAQLYLNCINTHDKGFAFITSELNRKRISYQTCCQAWGPWTDISCGIQEYQKRIPQKRRSDLQRCKKRAQKLGNLSLQVIRNSDDLDSILDTIFQIEYSSWKGRDGTAIKCDAAVESFYRGIADWAMRNGRLYIFILKLEDIAISMNLCLNFGSTMFCLKVGYDESFKNLSPGNLLYWEMFNYLCDLPQLKVFNFMGACERWKMEWTREINEYGWIRAYPKTLKGKTQYFIKYGWKNFLKHFDTVKKILESTDIRI